MSRYAKRADLIVHKEEPFNAETGPAALAEGPVTATDAFHVRGRARCRRLTPPRGGCTSTALWSESWPFPGNVA